MTALQKHFLFTVPAALMLFGCQNNGANLQSNVYKADQVNTTQGANVIKILAVEPAQIEVDNTQQKKSAEVIGGLLGAVAGGVAGHAVSHNNDGTAVGVVGGGVGGVAAGSLVSDKVLVDGVSITYEYHHNTFNSAQVGKLCQFEPGKAIVISTGPTSTRVQPNATCPTAPTS
jgi:outer membrane lipoprotein SlyB